MKLRLYILISALFISSALFCQVLSDEVTLSEQMSGIQDIVARRSVTMSPDFSYTSVGDSSFTARTDPQDLDIPDSDLTGGPGGTAGAIVGSGGVVGAVPGQFSVSPTGGATYSVPVECPAGINGMTPSVSLVYNSQAGNGIAGWGWNIAGTSSISRTPKTYYYDQEVEGIQWDATDNFSLDGQRLFIRTIYPTGATTADADSIEYITDNSLTGRIMGYDYDQTGPSSFIVWSGDGKISRYEQRKNLSRTEIATNYGSISYFPFGVITVSSTVTTPEEVKTIEWYISSISDMFGNKIRFSYSYDIQTESVVDSEERTYYSDSEYQNPVTPVLGNAYYVSYESTVTSSEINFRLTSIDYADDEYRLLFTYESRTDYLQGFLAGQKDYNCQRLLSVNVSYQQSTTLREYDLSYMSDAEYSKLEKVTIKGENDEEYNPTVFEWDNNDYTHTITDFSFQQPSFYDERIADGYEYSSSNKYPADFNGDGITDFFVIYTFTNDDDEVVVDWAVFLNDGTNTSLSVTDEGTMPIKYKFYLIDSDLDGKTEIFLQTSYSPSVAIFKRYYYTGSAFTYDSSTSLSMSLNGVDCGGATLVHADFEGDGLPDYILLEEDCTFLNALEFNNLASDPAFTASSGYLLLDFNGNGKSEIALKKESSIEFWEYSFDIGSFVNILTLSTVNDDDKIYPGDFNGDGNEDLLVYDDSDATWLILTSNGHYFLTDVFSIPSIVVRCLIADVNKDGKSDIIARTSTSPDSCSVLISQGNSFASILILDDRFKFPVFSATANTDNNIDIFFSKLAEQCVSICKESGFQQINKIYNGLGNELSLSYKINFSRYTTDKVLVDEETFMSIILGSPLMLKTVSSVVENNATSTFEFSEPVVHVNGKGFLGFGNISKTVNKPDVFETTDLVQSLVQKDDYTYELLPDSSTFSINSNNITAAKSNYTTRTVDDKIYIVVDSWVETNLFDNTSVTRAYINYDDYLMPGVITTTYKTEDTEEAVTTETMTYNSVSPDNWIFGQVSNKTVVQSRPDETSYSRIYNYLYNSDGTLSDSYTEMGTTKEVRTSYGYDSFGNVTSTTVVAAYDPYDSRQRVTTVTYSDDGRFPVSKTDVLGNTIAYEYYSSTGQLKKITDPNEFSTGYEYDGLGRKIKETFPNGNESAITLQWVNNDEEAPENAVFNKLSMSSGQVPQKTFYDMYGKMLRKVSYSFNGEAIYSDKQYDTSDRLLNESLPYFSDSSPLWTTYTYDSYNRPDEIESPDGTVKSYSYSPRETTLTVTTTAGTQSITRTVNSLGEVIASEDNAGNMVNTTYYASGMPKEYQMEGQSFSTSLTYDIYGKKTTITDPDAGTVTTVYNALGYLISQEDNKGNTATYTYDLAGRVLTSVQDNITTTYTYDTDKKGVISSVTDGYNTMSYEYDELGRVKSQTEILAEAEGDKTLTVGFTYDVFGRQKSQTWSTGYGIRYKYNDYGYLEAISDENTTIWSGSSINALGQYTSYSQDQYSTSVSYNSYGELSQVQTSGIRDMEYLFDRYGNLSSREDNISAQKEVFLYDALNRLTGIEYYLNEMHTVAGDRSIYYDVLGNITGKTELAAEGDIIYGEDDAGPHALTSIYSPVDYSPLNQSISYTAFNKIETITDTLADGTLRTLDLTYGFDRQRRKSVYTEGSSLRTKYFFGDYEEVTENYITTKYFYINSPIGICGIYKIEGGNPGELYLTFTDHLGSITEVVNASTGDIARQSFDAWGKPRSATDWTAEATYTLFADRGFTGHEHLQEFELINMNGRVYDPVLGRFLSPDPYVQIPDFSQNFNRYSYCLNNPINYSDPNGELFIIDDFIIGFFKKFIPAFREWLENLDDDENSFYDVLVNSLASARRHASNSFEIWAGLLSADRTQDDWLAQIYSRFTWEFPQTMLGFLSAHFFNMIYQVTEVDHWGGATTVQSSDLPEGNAITLGCYIIGGAKLFADPYTALFQHEYGHVLQSRALGWLYLIEVGLPSVTDKYHGVTYSHHQNPVEIDANARSLLFLMKNVDGFTYDDWYYYSHEFYDADGNQLTANDMSTTYLEGLLLWPNWQSGDIFPMFIRRPIPTKRESPSNYVRNL